MDRNKIAARQSAESTPRRAAFSEEPSPV